MAERATHQQLYQAFKDLYKAVPYVSLFLVRGITESAYKLPFIRKRFIPYDVAQDAAGIKSGEKKAAAIKQASDNLIVAEKMTEDALNVAAFSAIDAFSLQRERRLLIDIFRVPVAQELNISPDKVTFRDLRKSENMLVKLAAERYSSNQLWAWAINIPFAFITAMPLLHDPLNKLGRAIFQKQWGNVYDAATKLDSSNKNPEDAATQDESARNLTPRQLSGHATRPIMGVKAFYFLGSVLSQGKNSTTGMQQIGESLGAISKNQKTIHGTIELKQVRNEIHSRDLANLVYNDMVLEIHKNHPELLPDAHKTRFQRFRHKVRRTLNFREEPLWHQCGIEPLIVQPPDTFSLSVFKLMSEQMRMAMDPFRHDDYGLRSAFDLASFAYLVGHGWVDINHPENTQLWVRIGMLEGVDGLKKTEALIRQELASHPRGWQPSPQELHGLLKNYYVDSLYRQLEKDVGLTRTLTLEVLREDGKTEVKTISSFIAADVLGAYLLDHLLAGEYRATTPPGQRQMRSHIKLTEKQYEEFASEFEAHLRGETRGDYRLRNPDRQEIEKTIANMMVEGTFHIGDKNAVPSRTEPRYTTKNILQGELVPYQNDQAQNKRVWNGQAQNDQAQNDQALAQAAEADGMQAMDKRLQNTASGQTQQNGVGEATQFARARQFAHSIPDRVIRELRQNAPAQQQSPAA